IRFRNGVPSFRPLFVFLQNLGPRTFWAVHYPCLEAVFLFHIVFWQDQLKVPCRVGRFFDRVDSAAARRMRESNPGWSFEHDDEDHLSEVPIEKGRLKAKWREITIQGFAQAIVKPQVEGIVFVPNRALIVVGRRADLLPLLAVAEIHAPVVWSVNIASPEQADVAMCERMLRRSAAELHVDIMGRNELKRRTAFQVKGRSRRLQQVGFAVGQFLERHPGGPWVAEDLPGAVRLPLLAVRA